MTTDSAIFPTHDLADEQGHCRRIETQFLLQVAINLSQCLAPKVVIGIRLALMQKDALDDAVLGGNLGHCQQTLIRVAPVLVKDTVHPVALLLGDERCILILVEEGDGAALYGY